MGGYTCPIGSKRHGAYCFKCPVLTTPIGDGRQCRDFVNQRWAKAKEIDHTACQYGGWLGPDDGCYSCPFGAYRMTGKQPTDPGACNLDLKGEMRATVAEKWEKDRERRARVNAALAAFFKGSASDPDRGRIALMQQLLTEECKHEGKPNLIIWLRSDRSAPSRSLAVAMMRTGRNPVKWTCYRYMATTRRLLADGLMPPSETILLGWGPVNSLADDQMIGLVGRAGTGVFQGYDFKKFPSARRLVWELGVDMKGDAYYRHLQFDPEKLDRVDCNAATWSAG